MRNVIFVTTAAVLALSGCKKPENANAEAGATKQVVIALPPVKVDLQPITHQQMPKFLTLTGSIGADKQAEIAANVAGRVTQTLVERGQVVKAGQPIAIVDSKAASFSATAAANQAQAAETQVTLAKQECDRADTLFSQGAIPKAEFDRLKSQCTSQLFSANAARANADLSAKLAGDTIIRAPIDGIIGERYVNVGEYVQQPSKVASIYNINPARVTISVPEAAVALIKEGQTLNVTVSAWPGRNFPATVKFISPTLRTNTRDLIIEAMAKNDDIALKPGMFASVQLRVGEEEQPTVPVDAVRIDGTVKRIYLARNGNAYEMIVQTGVTVEGRIAVIEPLSKDERVIVKPPPGLRDGSAIQ